MRNRKIFSRLTDKDKEILLAKLHKFKIICLVNLKISGNLNKKRYLGTLYNKIY